MTEQTDKHKFILRLIKAMGIMCFIAAVILVALVIVMHIDSVKDKYEIYLNELDNFENKVASLDNKWLIMIVVLLLYVLRSLTPAFPYNAVYIICGMVFKPSNAFIINLAGMAFNDAFRFYTGRKMGEGYWNKVIHKHNDLEIIFDKNNRINGLVLLAARLVPGVPYNTVSHLYGSFGYPFIKYMVISLAACLPRLISYSFIGNNVYDPLSSQFYIPIIALLVLSGISCFFVKALLGRIFGWNLKKKGKERNHEHSDT